MARWYSKNGYRTKSKYKNKTTDFGGRKYDSKREATHAEELQWRLQAGEIKEIIPQYPIELKVNGVKICKYIVDFKVIKSDGGIEFHEVKGFATSTYLLKAKLFEALIDEIEPGAEYLVIR